MEALKQYEHKFIVNASLEQVVAFHKDPKTLKILTPPPMFLTFNDKNLENSESITDFNIWIGPLPIRWIATISNDGTNPGFMDHQVKGPFDYWEHRHIFRKIDSHRTEVIDQIKAQPGRGIPNWFISWSMWLTLRVLFAYRAWRTRYELEKDLA